MRVEYFKGGSGRKQIRVNLKPLQDNSRKAEQFMRSRIREGIASRGPDLQIQNVNAREVKLLLNKFLRHKGLSDYRVLSNESGLTVVPTKRNVDAKRFTPVASTKSETTPEYFPGLSACAATRFKTPHGYFGVKRIPKTVKRRGSSRNGA